ncbi:MAG: hypothetical protein R2828_34825 [Saprospiraceae bacterium]
MKFAFISFLLCFSALLFMSVSMEEETIIVHLDKPFYVGGETIWYQVYLPKAFEGQEVALKVGIADDEGRYLNDHFVKTGGKTYLNGYFKIPYELSPKVYHFLLLGTDKTSKQKIKLGECFVPIYSDLNIEANNTLSLNPPNTPATALNELAIAVDLSENSYQQREDIKVTVKVTDKQGKPSPSVISVAVKDAGLIQTGGYPSTSIYLFPLTTPNLVVSLDSAIYITGQVQTLSGKPWSSVILGAYSNQESRFYFTQSNEMGFFALPMPAFKGDKSLQFMDILENDVQITLDDHLSLPKSPALLMNEEVRQYLIWSQMRKKIYQLYSTIEAPLDISSSEIQAQVLQPDQRFPLKNYVAFDNLSIFFNEIITPLKFRKARGDIYTAKMFNPEQQIRQFYRGDPIFIVNGKLTRDANFVHEIPIEKIDTVDLFFDAQQLKQQFGPMGNSGMVVVKTSVPILNFPANDLGNIFSINGLLPDTKANPPAETAAHQPIFKSQLFWSSNINTDAKGAYQFTFPQSDDLGTFHIEVTGQSQDGARGYAVKSYKVD